MLTMRQVGRYARAVARHVMTGARVRSDAEVERLLSICKECEHYDGNTCGMCGCRCTRGKLTLTNKLRMASEHCPAGKW